MRDPKAPRLIHYEKYRVKRFAVRFSISRWLGTFFAPASVEEVYPYGVFYEDDTLVGRYPQEHVANHIAGKMNTAYDAARFEAACEAFFGSEPERPLSSELVN